MQINSTTSSLAVDNLTKNTKTTGNALPQVQPSTITNSSFSQYDLHSISPKEIDSLASKLRKSGDFDVKSILMLEAHGEKFQSHLSANANREFDASKKSDLIGSIEHNIEMSKHRNDPTDLAEGLLKLLQQIDATRSIPNEGLFA
jgi:hypothetical protein